MEFVAFDVKPGLGADDIAAALLGGLVLGVVVVFKTGFTGQVFGCSGITRSLIVKSPPLNKAAAIVGLALSGPLMRFTYGGFEDSPPPNTDDRVALIVRLVGGAILVGFGSAIGNGCTSGHGLTGLARLQLRSWVAVPTFMASGVLFATLTGTARSLPPSLEDEHMDMDVIKMVSAAAATILFVVVGCFISLKIARWRNWTDWKAHAMVDGISGLGFGAGLVISTMVKPSKVAGFLDLGSGVWDPSLCCVMAGALSVTFTFFTFLYFKGQDSQPLFQEKWSLPPRWGKIDVDLLAGSFMFGAGWGIAGACPGPVWVLLLGNPSFEALALWGGMCIGMGLWKIVSLIRSRRQPAKNDAAAAGNAKLEMSPPVAAAKAAGGGTNKV
eukprot:TRINITY_DN73465_c0_g1_i1.p1 TRINITY_DN73465_c0_g1~~TRINITY_DN73465_c0_g1_i1.p1  ORF type:complete len:409 (+),score=91.40 TRINITY_DN73465_c0_g1_i1:78-1229(+)